MRIFLYDRTISTNTIIAVVDHAETINNFSQ